MRESVCVGGCECAACEGVELERRQDNENERCGACVEEHASTQVKREVGNQGAEKPRNTSTIHPTDGAQAHARAHAQVSR